MASKGEVRGARCHDSSATNVVNGLKRLLTPLILWLDGRLRDSEWHFHEVPGTKGPSDSKGIAVTQPE